MRKKNLTDWIPECECVFPKRFCHKVGFLPPYASESFKQGIDSLVLVWAYECNSLQISKGIEVMKWSINLKRSNVSTQRLKLMKKSFEWILQVKMRATVISLNLLRFFSVGNRGAVWISSWVVSKYRQNIMAWPREGGGLKRELGRGVGVLLRSPVAFTRAFLKAF